MGSPHFESVSLALVPTRSPGARVYWLLAQVLLSRFGELVAGSMLISSTSPARLVHFNRHMHRFLSVLC